MTRTEYYDDPDAPAPNSLVVAAGAAVIDDKGRLLLQRRVDNGLWAMPGGAMEMSESLPQAAVREVREETGYEVEVSGLLGTYTDARHVIAYSDGEVRRQFNVCFRARVVGGELAVSDESHEVRWFTPEEVVGLAMHHTQRLRVEHALGRGEPHAGRHATWNVSDVVTAVARPARAGPSLARRPCSAESPTDRPPKA
ncbi:NUDIX domain-containing protein [Nocardiopsis tropica]